MNVMKTFGCNYVSIAVNDKGVIMNNGLTKREYFAASALQGLLVNHAGSVIYQALAVDSVLYADALIEALNERGVK